MCCQINIDIKSHPWSIQFVVSDKALWINPNYPRCVWTWLVSVRSVQLLSHVWLWDPTNRSRPGFSVHHQLPESTQTRDHRADDAFQPSHSPSSPSPPALNLPQHQGLFQWVSSLHQVAKVLEFQLQHQSSSEHPGLISFRMAWLDLLAVQGTLKSLLQHHSLKSSIFSALSFLYGPTLTPIHDYWQNHSFD